MTLRLGFENGALILSLMTTLWFVSVYKRDASIVDPFWSISFLLVTIHTAIRTGFTPAKGFLLVLVAVWALRLFGYLLYRSLGAAEDPRYAAFRKHFGAHRYWWVSFFQVFLLQGMLAWLISAPLQLAAAAPPRDPLAPLDAAVLGLFLLGFGFEAVADAQLDRFRREPANRGKVFDRGLFALTRHPNYFGEAVLWWAFGLAAIDEPYGLLALSGPVLKTFLLIRVSGVSMLDAHLKQTKPGYADYIQRTPALFPRCPWSKRSDP